MSSLSSSSSSLLSSQSIIMIFIGRSDKVQPISPFLQLQAHETFTTHLKIKKKEFFFKEINSVLQFETCDIYHKAPYKWVLIQPRINANFLINFLKDNRFETKSSRMFFLLKKNKLLKGQNHKIWTCNLCYQLQRSLLQYNLGWNSP